ncbi:MAG: hypothetical protein CML21_00560 [Rheinheimera sp.]|nr:hypothetical protein [Rheinheimera sp.]|tara:strand:+ start:1537 stop:1758 length:222 start_codon:yes stop_codon:yes gene_type:complete
MNLLIPIFLTLGVIFGLYIFHLKKQPKRFVIINPDNIIVGSVDDEEQAKHLKSRGYTVAREIFSRRGTYFKPI